MKLKILSDILFTFLLKSMAKKKDKIPCEIEKVLDNPTKIALSVDNVRDEPIGETLTPRQQRFCELYALDREFFGNWVQAYLEIYDVDTSKPGWYKTACASSSRLLSNAKVFNRINDLLESSGLNDSFVDKQLLFLLSQQDDKWAKMAAIKEYNSMKQRITKKIELESQWETSKKGFYDTMKNKIDSMNTEELNTVLQDLLK